MADRRKITDLTVDEIMGIKTEHLEAMLDKLAEKTKQNNEVIIEKFDELMTKKLEFYGLPDAEVSRKNQDWVTETRTNGKLFKDSFITEMAKMSAVGAISSFLMWVGLK